MADLINKSKCLLYLDTSKTIHTTAQTGWVATWKRVKKSTILSIAANVQTEDSDYICYESPVTEITGYKPTLDQEQMCEAGDAIYEFLINFWHNRCVGDDATVPVLICYPQNGQSTPVKVAEEYKESTVTITNVDYAAQKITYTINLGGTPVLGTYTTTGTAPDLVPTFVEPT